MPVPASQKTAAFVHVDLDGLWTLAAVYGFREGDAFTHDAVWQVALDRLLDLLADLDIPATFFLVGRDLELPDKQRRAAAIAAAGHELANHSFSHRIDLENLPPDDLHADYARAQQLIAQHTGFTPIGARAPGYAAGPRTRAVLSRLGLRYDGSVLDTPWTPLLRFMAGRVRNQVRSALPPDQRLDASMSLDAWYGPAVPGRGAQPWWEHPEPDSGPLLRIPVSLSPRLRLPIHASLGVLQGEARVARALRRLSQRPAPICYLVHGLDLLGAEDLAGRLPRALAGHRAFGLPRARKLQFLRAILSELRTVAHIQRTDQWFRFYNQTALEAATPPPDT